MKKLRTVFDPTHYLVNAAGQAIMTINYYGAQIAQLPAWGTAAEHSQYRLMFEGQQSKLSIYMWRSAL